jgi:hypothetical protein
MRQSERAARNLKPVLFITEAQLKKLVNEAVTLHRDICTCNGSVLLPLAGGNL